MYVVEKWAIYEQETTDRYYNIGHIKKRCAWGHQLLKKSLDLDTSVTTKSDTTSANSAKLDKEDHEHHEEESEPIIHDEGLSSSQVEVIEMLFSSQIIFRAQITFDIVRKIMAEHMPGFKRICRWF